MIKYSLLFSFFFFLAMASQAIFEENIPTNIRQPDGTTVACYVTGDEYYLRVHDADGFTIIRDPQTGFLVYAVLQNDELVSSGYFVGKTDPKSVRLTPLIDISAAKRTQIRNDFWKNIQHLDIL